MEQMYSSVGDRNKTAPRLDPGPATSWLWGHGQTHLSRPPFAHLLSGDKEGAYVRAVVLQLVVPGPLWATSVTIIVDQHQILLGIM